MESDPRPRSPRRLVVTALAAAVVAALAYSLWKDVPHSWRLMRSQYRAYAGDTSGQRARAFGVLTGMPMDILDFWRAGLQPGDRYYVQMPPMPYSSIGDKRYIMRSIAHVYLLPAIEATSLRKATVVLTWGEDPRSLPVKYASNQESGLQLIFVSRIARGA